MQNIFLLSDKEVLIGRINKLTPTTQPLWGKMNVAQMLAHCNLAPFAEIYNDNYKKPNLFARLFLRLVVKPVVAGNKPYKKNGPTGPGMKVTTEKDFAQEKENLIGHINKTHALGLDYFLDKEISLGKLTKTEWENLFYKHLNHHLTQFGV